MAEVSVPKKCIAGVCVNEEPDFKLHVEVDVLEPGMTTLSSYILLVFVLLSDNTRAWPTAVENELHRLVRL